MDSIGERLKKTRENLGISLAEVHEKTKIPLDILKSIESDIKKIKLDDIYLKGFLKIYAKFLNLDIKTIFPEDKSRLSPEEAIIKPRVSASKKPKISLSPEKTFFLFKLVLIIVVVLLAFFIINSLRKKIKLKAPVALKADKVVAAKIATKIEKIGNLKLAIKAKNDTWLRVKVDGNINFQGILHQGAAESWLAKDKFEISVANAGAIEIELNGKILPALGRKGQALKNIVINKEGFSVE